MKVVIVGSGISGLTVAHYLNKNGFEVEVYEKNDIAGGMARSLRTKDGIPTEHSWRGYAPFYYNLFNLIKEIPVLDDTLDLNNKLMNSNVNQTENIIENKTHNPTQNQSNPQSKVTIDEIKKHVTEDSLWTIYKGKVYDITHFIDLHPGGKKHILSTGAKDVEEVWKENNISHLHLKNTRVLKQLTKNLVGDLVETMTNHNKTVYDNLNHKKLKFELLFDQEKDKKVTLSLKDKLFLFVLFAKVIFSNLRRVEYYNIRLDPILKKNLSKNGYHFLVDFISGPGYGLDKNSMSLGHFAIFAYYAFREKEKLWKVMGKPTSEAWIDPWVKYLKKKGVKFYFKHELKSMDVSTKLYGKNAIHSVENLIMVNNSGDKMKPKSFFPVNADLFCVAINPFNLEYVLEKSFNTQRPHLVKDVKSIVKNFGDGNLINNQISFRLGFSEKLNLEADNLGFVLVDSQYNITFYNQADHWKENDKYPHLGKVKNKPIKTLFSGTIIQPYNEGGLYKKSALELTKKQLIEEVIYQFKKCNQFNNMINKMNQFNSEHFYNSIIFTEIFEDWEEVKTDDGVYLKSKNLKYVNNFINEENRLDHHYSNITNLFFSGGHTKNSVKIWSMEGSVESGILTTNEIIKKYNYLTFPNDSKLNLLPIKRFCHERDGNEIFPLFNKISNLLKNIDNILYKIELPNVIFWLLSFIFFFIFY